MKKLLIIAVVAVLAVPAMATAGVPLASGSCPVNLKVMPIATVVAPSVINVAITTIDQSGIGSSSGLDYGTFTIATNLAWVHIAANILSPGLSGGTWKCKLQGKSSFANPSENDYPGPIPAGSPFDVFVQVTGVNMLALPWDPAFVYDTTLILTMSSL